MGQTAMTISTKIYSIVALMTLVTLVNAAIGLYLSASLDDNLHAVYDNHVESLQKLKVVSDSYAVNIVDIAHKTISGASSWGEARRTVYEAKFTADRQWKTFLVAKHHPEEEKLVTEILPLLKSADVTVDELYRNLSLTNREGLAEFVTTELYPAIEPLTAAISKLQDLELRLVRQEFLQIEHIFHDGKRFTFIILLLGTLLSWSLTFILVRRLMRKMKENDRFLRELIDSNPGMMGYWNSELRCEFANLAYQEWFGRSQQGMHGIHIRELLGEKLFANVEFHINEVLRGNRQLFELTMTKSDGRVGHIWIHYTPNLVDGQVRGYFSNVLDVTDLKQTEDALWEKDKFARSTLDGLSAHICVIDASGMIVSTNRAWREFAEENQGVGQKCGVGANYLDACCSGETGCKGAPEEFRIGISAVLDGFLPEYTKDYSCHAPDKDRWFFCRANPFTVSGTNYAVISHVDITWRVQAENRLRKLSRAVEQSTESIMITDTNGTIEFVNPKFTEITGYSAEEAIGKNPRILKSGNTPPETYRKLWSTIMAGKTWDGEFANKRKDGALFWEHATISALIDDSGVITHYLGVKEDITEKKSIMQQLLHSQKIQSIGQLAGGLAHDLNNILTVVNGYAVMAQLRMDPDQQEFQCLNEIMAASSRASSLTHSLLAYSRKQAMNQQNQHLNVLITDIASFIKRLIHDNIELTLNLTEHPLVVYVDPVQIEQILLNLATNARDAMPDGGMITIATSLGSIDECFIAAHGYGKVGEYAVVTVSDTGVGIPPEIKLHVFDPFFTTKESGKGTGLGLAMVMGIIKQHGGFVELESEPGEGTVFHLYLPLTDSGDIPSALTEADVQLEKGSGTILVAEDDPETLTAIEEFLTRVGYTVVTAVNGEDAVEKFTLHKDEIRLVISDVVMPKKSGKAACYEIRNISDDVKFIFISGHTFDVVSLKDTIDTDAEIILKPLQMPELLRKIRALLHII